MRRILTAVCAMCASLPCHALANAQESDLAITNARIVDLDTGDASERQTILISDGRITSIRPTGEVEGARETFDAHGAYVIPGLWDMHVHFRQGLEGSDDLTEANAELLPQFVGYGVTSIRDAGGDMPEAVLRWREEIAEGTRIGPRIYTSLRKFDGPGSLWPGAIELTDVADIAPAMDALVAQGVDFIKVYDSTISRAIFLGVVEEAERRGLPSGGHLPMNVAWDEAIAAGYDSFEHEDYLVKAGSSEDLSRSLAVADAQAAGETPSRDDYFAALAMTQSAQSARESFSAMIDRGAVFTSTLGISRLLDAMTDTSGLEADPRLANVPPALRDTFAFRVKRQLARSPEDVAAAVELSDLNRSLFSQFVAQGVTVIAGTDTGANNSYIYTGSSLHDELQILVDLGMTPLGALRAATVNAAGWFGAEDEYGAVAEGSVADLVMLRANPARAIGATREIQAVAREGRIFDAAALEDLRTLAPED